LIRFFRISEEWRLDLVSRSFCGRKIRRSFMGIGEDLKIGTEDFREIGFHDFFSL
jgi:hypothetical protein